jgi:anti-sigma-K factor RskA
MESRRSRGRWRAALAMLAIIVAAVALVLVTADKVNSTGLTAAITAAGPGVPALRLHLTESERLLYRAQLCSMISGGDSLRFRGAWDCIAR